MLKPSFWFLVLSVYCSSAPGVGRAGVPVPNLTGEPTPPPVPMTCPALIASFTSIAADIQTVSAHSRSAAFNATGLGYFSPGKHFRSVEDDFAAARKTAKTALSRELAIKLGLDRSELGIVSAALLAADDSALHEIYRYAAVAVTYERAVNAKNLAEQTQYSYMGLMVGGVTSPTYGIGAVGTIATAPQVATATLSAQQMRSLMESAAPDIASIEQSLAASTSAFNAACPT